MSERKAPGKHRRAKPMDLLRHPFFDEHPLPGKLAVWTGRLPEERHDALTPAHIRRLAPLPSREQLEDRAKRIKGKIASWDREKLENYYTRTLLSGLLLRNSQRMLDQVLPLLAPIAAQQKNHQELRETARILALHANMLFKLEKVRRCGYSKGGLKGASQNHGSAVQRHDRWYAEYRRYLAEGGDPRHAASALADRFDVTPRAFREGIKEARARRK